ncbi:conserved hypothetical protein [Hahella chejuensis KCTC 2396]|uniref:DUF3570 domain-containing protein n=1 Tax=Hahella chejuensis (strain KCTC 2396) TaxID=349521 RepID=Q2SIY3_HAHCH|nr:DUF3570 domain-containing protein [Hahella chejuensis]ABC29391.1 conserved hypothetical protein [Hahella chejuensis KCTC 2396]
MRNLHRIVAIFSLLATALSAGAAVLPEEKAEAMYHRYEGGGMEIDGPSVLVRKNFDASFSLSANYYVDSVSSASVDVLARATPYEEERTEGGLGVDYLYNKSIMSFAYTNSQENDFDAESIHFNISQDFFGDLTTLSMGYSKGWDNVRSKLDPSLNEEVDRQHYRLGVTQVLTKNALLNLDIETVTDEGYLNNPYRVYRFLDSSSPKGYEYRIEKYPKTRTSNAVALRGMYYLPYRAAIKGEFRYFSDSWNIKGYNYELAYVHPFGDQFITEFKFRHYEQTKAEFYDDLFEGEDVRTFMGRDKELSTYSGDSVGVGLTYEFNKGFSFIEKGSINLFVDFMKFEYEDFRDVTRTGFAPGEEPLYEFDATVIRFFVTASY